MNYRIASDIWNGPRLITSSLDGKMIAYSSATEFLVQVGKKIEGRLQDLVSLRRGSSEGGFLFQLDQHRSRFQEETSDAELHQEAGSSAKRCEPLGEFLAKASS